MNLKQWKTRDDLRIEWAKFISSDAGKAVFELAMISALPRQRAVDPKDAMTLLALDGASLAGWHQCLRFLASLAIPRTPKDFPKPWEGKHVTESENGNPQ